VSRFLAATASAPAIGVARLGLALLGVVPLRRPQTLCALRLREPTNSPAPLTPLSHGGHERGLSWCACIHPIPRPVFRRPKEPLHRARTLSLLRRFRTKGENARGAFRRL
jgi:hypothetical protein